MRIAVHPQNDSAGIIIAAHLQVAAGEHAFARGTKKYGLCSYFIEIHGIVPGLGPGLIGNRKG